tara:strand:+ start:60762 stop:61907 length:1146 start_codon:yes stop_codon:yes gene_type:complete
MLAVFQMELPLLGWFAGEMLLNLVRPIPFFRKKSVGREPACNEWKSWGADDDLHPCIENACHAIAVNDERKTFHPVMWLEFTSDDTHTTKRPDTLLKKVEQVWFAGAHANVGGGYPKDHPAHVPLQWMMLHACREGLKFDTETWSEYHQRRDELGKLYDSRSGGSMFYRYQPRSILEISREVGIHGNADDLLRKPRLHRAVLRRVEQSTSSYAPYGPPEPNRYIEVQNPNIEIPDSGATDEWNDVPDRLKRLISNTDAAGSDEELHYELSWSSADTREEQNQARRTARAEAIKLSDLRLCCYYALCIWAVAFLIIGVGFFAASAMPVSAGENSLDMTVASRQMGEQIVKRLDLLYGDQLCPVFTPLTLGLLVIPVTVWGVS